MVTECGLRCKVHFFQLYFEMMLGWWYRRDAQTRWTGDGVGSFGKCEVVKCHQLFDPMLAFQFKTVWAKVGVSGETVKAFWGINTGVNVLGRTFVTTLLGATLF